MVGKSLSHYKILEELGRGGMGIVYRAHDEKLDRDVAIKVLPPGLTDDPVATERFIREARAAAKVDHPNICSVYDIGEAESGQTYVVMAYYPGKTLADLSDTASIGQEQAIGIALQIADGLNAAHAAGIVHRDIKPGNVMIADDGRVRILDFGLAKLAGKLDLTKTGRAVGTPLYMSPEQVRGEEVDNRTDIWSLGVLLYQLLSGDRPFKGQYEAAVSYAILNQDPASLGDVPKPIADSVAKMLSKNPEGRYASCAEIFDDLKSFGGELSRTHLSSPSAPISKSSGRFKGVIVGAASLILLAAVLFFVILSGDETPGNESDIVLKDAIAVFPFSTSEEHLAPLSEGFVDLIAMGIDGIGDIRSIDPYMSIGIAARETDGPLDPARAAELSRSMRASNFVLGSLLSVGSETVRISASLYDADGEVLGRRTEVTYDSDNGLLPAVDELIRELVASRFTSAGATRKTVAASTTNSVEALKSYLEGERLMRAGLFDEAHLAYGQAKEIDSTFALAWFRTVIATFNYGNADERVIGLKKAVKYSGELPDRERDLIQSEYDILQGNVRKAERTLKRLTQEFPEDVEIWTRLGELQRHHLRALGEDANDAIPTLKKALKLAPNNAEILFHLVEDAVWTENIDRLDSLLLEYPERENMWKSTFERVRDLMVTKNPKQRDSLITIVANLDLEVARNVAYRSRRYDLKTAYDIFEAIGSRNDLSRDELKNENWNHSRARLYYSGQLEDYGNIFFEEYTFDCDDCPEFFKWVVATSPMSPLLGASISELDADLVDAFTDLEWTGVYSGLEQTFLQFHRGSLAYVTGDQELLIEQRDLLAQAHENDDVEAFSSGFTAMLDSYKFVMDGNLEEAKAMLQNVRYPFWGGEGDWATGLQLARQLEAEILIQEGDCTAALPILESLNTHSFYRVSSWYLRAQCHYELKEDEKALELYEQVISYWQDADAPLQPVVQDSRRQRDAILDAMTREPAN